MEDIGARIVIDPGASVETLTATTDAVKRLNAALAKLGVTSEATMAKLAKTGDAAVAAGEKSSVAAEEAGLAGGAAVASHGKAVQNAAKDTENLTKKTASLKSELIGLSSGTMGKIGRDSLIAGIGIAGDSIDQYMKYQKAITQLSTQAGLSASRLPAMFQGGLDIAKKTGLNFSDVANQLYRIVSATSGLKETNKQILALGRSAANIAVLFQTSPGAPTEQVARLFGSIRVAGASGKLQQTGGGGIGTEALLNATVGTGDIRGQDLIGALGRGILQAGEGVHARLPDILTWLDLSTKLGAQPSTSGTLIAHSIQQLAGGTVQAKHVEAMAGVTPDEMANLIQTKGIGAAFTDLSQKLQNFNPLSYYPSTVINGTRLAPGKASAEGQFQQWLVASPSDSQAFFNGTASPKVRQEIANQLLAKMFGGARQEIPALTAIENQTLWQNTESLIRLRSTPANFNKDLTRALGTPQQQLEESMRSLQAYSVELGKDLTPALLKFVHGVVGAAEWLDHHRDAFNGIAAIVGGFLGLSVGVYAVGKILKVVDAIGGMFKAIGKIGTTGFSSIFGGTASKAADAPLITALQENAGATARLAEVMGVADGEGAGRGLPSVFQVGSRGAAETTFGPLGPETGAVETAGGFSLGKLFGSGKVLQGGLTAAIATVLYNSFGKSEVQKLIGHGNVGKGVASAAGDTLTGALVGNAFLPGIGAIIGAAGGAVYSQRHTSTVQAYLNGLHGTFPNLAKLQAEQHADYLKTHPLEAIKERTANEYRAAIKTDLTQDLMTRDTNALDKAGFLHGVNSSQYKTQLGYMIADMKKEFGKGVLGKYSGTTALQLATASPDYVKFISGLAQHRAQQAVAGQSNTAWFKHNVAANNLASLVGGGGDLRALQVSAYDKAVVKGTRQELKTDKLEGGSLDHIRGVEDQLKRELEAQHTLQADMKAVTKTSDIQKQTTALVAATKSKDSTQTQIWNNMLGVLQNIQQNTKNLNTIRPLISPRT